METMHTEPRATYEPVDPETNIREDIITDVVIGG